MLQAIRVLAVAPILWTPRRLHECGVPRLRTQCSQGCCRMEGAGTHFHVIGLQDNAALLRPEMLQREDQILEGLAGVQGGSGLYVLHRRRMVSGFVTDVTTAPRYLPTCC